ncbi:helix-turn-helix transcriptional regulator [Salinimonas sp. HHU 13199]|uniref:Helix-turn-helix transcriptional regulator n=1 Tax=Salinimonas profundi TaxID=2729140 RepID=A0ABR8LMX6_9ALTE|nr:helix-turn-helix transcriptional regulator [Salinimonas profundi]MBD3586708.1 helix-turn-helix transcriptional regulator [Salinimonas profundi]
MDMKIDSKLIVQYRHQRAWSQQHLSVVSGVSLRTIQRVENEGNASYETLKAIAAAFDTDVTSIAQTTPHLKTVYGKLSASAILVVSILISLFITSSTTAATGVEIQATSVSQSQDRTVTHFTGEVSMTIPHQVPFNITTCKHSALSSGTPYQLTITADNATFLVQDANITMSEEGIKIAAVRITARSSGVPE